MSDTPQLQFFVYVVESPSAPDLYHKRSEAELIRGAVGLNGMPCTARCAINRVAFAAALQLGLKEEMERLPDYFPLLHISSHGGPEGIELSSGDLIRWRELAELLVPINRSLEGKLVVAMSCCEGYSGIQMAMRADDGDLAFHALIGTPAKPTWAETAVAFTTFYHQIARGAHISDAVDAMRVASGLESFYVQWGEQTRQSFLDYVRQATIEAPSKLEEEAQRAPAADAEQMRHLEKGG